MINTIVAEETLTLEQLQKFFEERPSLAPNSIGIEAGYSVGYLNKIMNGDRPLTDSTAQKLLPILIKYGFRK